MSGTTLRTRWSWLLVGLTAAVVLVTCGKPPVVDEEVYLFLARVFLAEPLRPYDFQRIWQPWGAGPHSFHFAHPPLHAAWVALWSAVQGQGSIPALRVLVALPPALLLVTSVARLAGRMSPRPNLALAAWLVSPVTLLALGAGLMVDLTAAALATAAMASWRDGVASTMEGGRRWGSFLLAGALMGLAGATKYPTLVLLPVALIHGWRVGVLTRSLPFWLGFALVWGLVEGWLALQYGQLHLLAVLEGAPEIARGSLPGRLLGVLARGSLVALPLMLFIGRRSLPLLAAGAVLAGLALAAAAPEGLGAGQAVTLWAMAALGCGLLLLALVMATSGAGAGDGDSLLLGAWALAFPLAVVLGHNFASGRYLLPMVAPAAILLTRLVRPGASPLLWPSLAAWGALGAAMLVSDGRHAAALDHLAREVDHRFGASEDAPGGRYFSGEWAFRHRLEEAGWRAVASHGEDLTPGDLVATVRHSAVGPLPMSRLALLHEGEAPQSWPLRLVDQESGAGYYGETLGPMPFWFRVGPMEEVLVYRVLP